MPVQGLAKFQFPFSSPPLKRAPAESCCCPENRLDRTSFSASVRGIDRVVDPADGFSFRHSGILSMPGCHAKTRRVPAEKPSSILRPLRAGNRLPLLVSSDSLMKPNADLSLDVVIDTNAVLDWLLFDDPRIAPLAQAVRRGHIRWLTCEQMRVELKRTLGYSTLARWAPDSEALLRQFDHWSARIDRPPSCADTSLRCSDPDDQVFIDLAVSARATALVTHDRALLRLARPALRFGLTICRPADWAAVERPRPSAR